MTFKLHTVENYFTATETTVGDEAKNVILHFGPLSASLISLFEDGWYLICNGQKRSRFSYSKYRIYLTRNGKSYKLGSISQDELNNATSLVPFLKRNIECASVAERKEYDQFQDLRIKYPKPKKEVMIGNMTLREYVIDTLRKPET